MMLPRTQFGYTYLTLLFAVAVVGVGLASASSLWHTAQMREKERELLYVGEQYRKAIEEYYKQGKTYPRELTQLLRDQRVPGVRRYLRKLYRDPITGKSEWGLVKSPDGGIAGVHSLSEEAPFKQAEFSKAQAEFTGKTKYSDWKFAYLQAGKPDASPQGAPGAPSPQGTPGAPASPGAPGTPSPQGGPGALPSGGMSQGSAGAAVPFGTPSGGATQAPPAGPTGSAQSGSGGASAFGAPGGGAPPTAPRP
jgi:type II secretory pathway pseudopilin PulG